MPRHELRFQRYFHFDFRFLSAIFAIADDAHTIRHAAAAAAELLITPPSLRQIFGFRRR
jgi:hypothetical protein